MFHQEREQFSTRWHLEEASSDGWQPLKVLPRCWHENLLGLCRSHLILGGCGVIGIVTVETSTVLTAPDLFPVRNQVGANLRRELLPLNLQGTEHVVSACSLLPGRCR